MTAIKEAAEVEHANTPEYVHRHELAASEAKKLRNKALGGCKDSHAAIEEENAMMIRVIKERAAEAKRRAAEKAQGDAASKVQAAWRRGPPQHHASGVRPCRRLRRLR